MNPSVARTGIVNLIIFKFRGTDATQYKQLGNSVNVRVLKILGERLFALANDGWDGDFDG